MHAIDVVDDVTRLRQPLPPDITPPVRPALTPSAAF